MPFDNVTYRRRAKGATMKYALLIYQDKAFEQEWTNPSEELRNQVYGEFSEFGKLLEQRDAMIDGAELGLSHTATTVRKRSGEVTVTDGPFAEVAEQLGGYYIVKAADLDEALELARALPSDTVEVRPVVEHEGAT
jgi:hypothetical protein